MNRSVSAFSMLVMLEAVVVVSGCIKRMKMPSEELMWQPAPDRFERGAERFEEVGRLTAINGSPDFMIFDVIESGDGQVIAASANTYWDSVPGEANYAKGRRNSEFGVVIWPVGGGDAEWAVIPPPYPEYDGSWPTPLCFSADNSLLAVERDERVSICSRPEGRILSTFRISDQEKITFPSGGGAHIAGTAWVEEPRFSVGGHAFTAIVVRQDTTNRVTWATATGECIESEVAKRPTAPLWMSRVPWTYEGAGSGDYVAPFRYDPIKSSDGQYLAAAFAASGYFLGMGDDTPGHLRVWDTRTEKLVSWSGATEELHRWNCPKPLAFLSRPAELLHADREGLHIVDVESRRVVASMPFPDPNVWLVKVVWLPYAKLVAVEGRDSFTLIRVKE